MVDQNAGTGSTRGASYSQAKTVCKAFALLEYIAAHQPVRPAELGRALRLTRTNVHRLLATLEGLGYLEPAEGPGVRLSYKLFQVGSTVIESSNLRETAHPLLAALSREVGEDACLTVRHEKVVIIVERIKSPNVLTLDHDIARTYPLHCTGSGKVFLAAMADEPLERLLAELDLTARAARTIIDREELLCELRRVREQGYARDLGEYDDDIHTVAAPVLDHTRRIIATISVSGPTNRLPEDKMDCLVRSVCRTAAELSRRMGCDLPDPLLPPPPL